MTTRAETTEINLKRGGYVEVRRDLNGMRLECGWADEGMASVDLLDDEVARLVSAIEALGILNGPAGRRSSWRRAAGP